MGISDHRPGVLAVVDEYRDRFDGKKVQVAPDIEGKKLNKAIAAYASDLTHDDVLLLADTTLFGGAKNGLLVTASALHVGETLTEPVRIVFDEITTSSLNKSKLVVNDETLLDLATLNDNKGPLAELIARLATETRLQERKDRAGSRTGGGTGPSTGTGDEVPSPPTPEVPKFSLGPAIQIEWSLAPPASPADKGRLNIVGSRECRPGATVRFTVQADPWPDPKLGRAEVRLLYRSSYLDTFVAQPQSLSGQLLSSQGLQTCEVTSSGDDFDETVIAEGAFDPEDLGADGRIMGSFVLPDPCPPSLGQLRTPGYWSIDGRMNRSRGLDKRLPGYLEVLGPDATSLNSTRPELSDPRADWLHRVAIDNDGAASADSLAPADRHSTVDIQLDHGTVVPGGSISGRVVFTPDEQAIDLLPRRRRRDATAAGEVKIPGIGLRLECWRGSTSRGAMHLMGEGGRDGLTHALVVRIGQAAEFPFEWTMPDTLQVAPYSGMSARPVATPTTFFGTTFDRPVLDDIRWRLVAAVDSATTHGWGDPVYRDGPHWAVSEILVVTDPS